MEPNRTFSVFFRISVLCVGAIAHACEKNTTWHVVIGGWYHIKNTCNYLNSVRVIQSF